MASVIILIYGEGRHLVPKPADSEILLDVARVKFPELNNFDNDNIAFHFTPKWFDGEVELDRNAFTEVQDREVLRISTNVSGTAQQPYSYFKIRGETVLNVGLQEWKVLPSGWLRMWFFHIPTDRTISYAIKPNQRFRRLMAHMATVLEFDLDNTGFYFDDNILDPNDTPHDWSMVSRDVIEVHYLI